MCLWLEPSLSVTKTIDIINSNSTDLCPSLVNCDLVREKNRQSHYWCHITPQFPHQHTQWHVHGSSHVSSYTSTAKNCSTQNRMASPGIPHCRGGGQRSNREQQGLRCYMCIRIVEVSQLLGNQKHDTEGRRGVGVDSPRTQRRRQEQWGSRQRWQWQAWWWVQSYSWCWPSASLSSPLPCESSIEAEQFVGTLLCAAPLLEG